jgi:disulfide bond formation protein DsbB
LALVVALAASAGSVLLSGALGLVPCPLCYYQRTFAFACAGVLAVGVFTGMGRTTALASLALPLAAGGLWVAAYHVWLEGSGKLICPNGLFGLGTAPQQSLAAFVLLTLILLSDAWQDLRAGGGWSACLGGIVLGLVFAAGGILTASSPCEGIKDPAKTCHPRPASA